MVRHFFLSASAKLEAAAAMNASSGVMVSFFVYSFLKNTVPGTLGAHV